MVFQSIYGLFDHIQFPLSCTHTYLILTIGEMNKCNLKGVTNSRMTAENINPQKVFPFFKSSIFLFLTSL